MNVCIFNIPESPKDNPEASFKADVEKLHSVLKEKIELKKEDIKTFYRRGKELNPEKVRPIIVSLANRDIREKLLKLRNLQYVDSDKSCNIYINPDRTPREIEAHKLLVKELRERRANSEDNLIIKNGKIITNQPFRFKPQNYWGNGTES